MSKENGFKGDDDEKSSLETTSRQPYTEIKRETWSRRIDFIFSCTGFAVGLGNIWRFPYLCYKNGGGAFLVPYLIFLIGGGIPILLLEVGVGQFMRKGGLKAWDICPLFKGIGFATMCVDTLMNSYYIMVLVWAVYYFFASFTSVLPWSHCNNPWNTPRCALQAASADICRTSNTSLAFNSTTDVVGCNSTCRLGNCTSQNTTLVDPTVEYWERQVLQISTGVDDTGVVIWELALCLLFVWTVVYFCVWRGVKWTGKVVYFTASFPYVVLFALLLRGLTLEGAFVGIEYYLKPNFNRLSDPQVWIDGGTQIFFSYGIALGAMVCLGSYNKFNNNFYKDCLIISCINSGTSILGGFVVFSVLGFMSVQQNVPISEVADSGPGLVFLAYPKAVTEMPLSPLWSCLFFFMLFLVGLDSEFVGVESLITHVIDLFPNYLYKKKGRMLFTLIYCACSYLIGLSMVTQGGMYVFQLFDYYSASGLVLLWLCFWESIVIGWIFGADNFYNCIEAMVGYRINIWFKFCWKFFTPAITAGIFLFDLIKFSPLTYNNNYIYPSWAQGIGMSFALVSMICVPAVVIVQISLGSGGLIQRLKKSIKPIYSFDHPYGLAKAEEKYSLQEKV